jgi:hypothetical protein
MSESSQPTEIDTLKARAKQLGISFHPSIGLDKLREKVTANLNGEPDPSPDTVEYKPSYQKETIPMRNARLRAEASELVRIRVTCMNPNRKAEEGQIFTAGNTIVGTHKKFVPFDNEEGWHVPKILLHMIQGKKCQIFVKKKNRKGVDTVRGKIIKEFAVEIMEPLTEAETKALATRQAMARGEED